MEKLSHKTHHVTEALSRSVIKTLSYRVFIILLDFGVIFLLTGKTTVALGFTLISNLYTTFGYFIHERFWDKIKWGKIIYKKA